MHQFYPCNLLPFPRIIVIIFIIILHFPSLLKSLHDFIDYCVIAVTQLQQRGLWLLFNCFRSPYTTTTTTTTTTTAAAGAIDEGIIHNSLDGRR